MCISNVSELNAFRWKVFQDVQADDWEFATVVLPQAGVARDFSPSQTVSIVELTRIGIILDIAGICCRYTVKMHVKI